MMHTSMRTKTNLEPAIRPQAPILKRIALMIGISLVGFAILFATSAVLAMVVWNGVDAGQPAPSFSGHDINDQPIALADYAGKPVMLTFWSPDCSACRQELPTLQSLATDASADVTLLTVVSQLPAAEVQQFMQEAGLTFPVLVDESGDIATDYEITGVPISYFINPNGQIDHSIIGADRKGALENNLFAWLGTCKLAEVCR